MTADKPTVTPLTAEEETRVRDFYERRTTRLNMGSSVLIPRLLATIDALRDHRHWARELLGVEPVDNGDGTETVRWPE